MISKLHICRGKDCRKHRRRLVLAAEHVSDLCETGTVKCQDVCKGPVLVVHHGEHRHVFKKMKGSSIRAELRSWLMGAPMSDDLQRRLVKRKRRKQGEPARLKGKKETQPGELEKMVMDATGNPTPIRGRC